MLVNLSYIQLTDKVIEAYNQTKSGWKNKDVEFKNIYKPMSSSNIQFAPTKWKNGYKTSTNLDRSNQNCIVVDYDDGLPINEFQKIYRGNTYCLATTKSHQKEKKGITVDRYRAVFPAINISQDDSIYFRAMELLFPDNDVQTLTKTGAFLGNNNAIIVYNYADTLDMFPYNELAKEQLTTEKNEELVIDPDFYPDYSNNSLAGIKEQLDRETVCDVLSSLGYELEGNKFSIREERTKSVKVYVNGSMYDFGDSRAYDIFGILTEYHDKSFKEALNYVSRYI